jgi:hypothetical protein
MLAKEPNYRPSALEVRQVARAVSHAPSELAESIDVDFEVEIDDLDLDHMAALADGSGEIPTDDADDVTLLKPSMRKPRWTPPVPNDIPAQRDSSRSITPRSLNDAVAGEIRARRG